MLTLFLNPFTMIAGAGLISAPIIIHLINRLRYRRVHWAAMEFLLKSLKRNRRKLIIEQMILLFLRILLVFLFGLLLARYLGATIGFGQPRGTVHVVLLDDTASMTDSSRDGGIARSAFDRAKVVIVDDIAAGAAEAGTPQALELIRLSNPDESFKIDRIAPQNLSEIRSHVDDLKPTALHSELLPAIEAARLTFDRYPSTKRVLHIVSDFRSKDWTGPGSEALAKAFPEAVGGKNGALHLLDVAHPVRSATRKTALDHGNVGLVDLQPDTRVVGKLLPVEFTLTVANFTQSARKHVRVHVKINGQSRDDASVNIPDLPPGLTQQTFIATFDQLGPNTVTAAIEHDEAGLMIDDLRYAVVEVREKVPLLFVTADVAARGKPESDGFFLRALFLDAAKGFDVVERGPQELEQPSLDRYPAIYLLNVPRLSDKARANLETYVKNGGGLFIALGDQVDVDFYNRLHAEGKGLFPVPLAKPTEPLTDAQRFERMFDPTWPAKVFVRADAHPILARLFRDDRNREVNTYLKFLFVERYVPVPRTRWSPEPGRTEELLTLPNYRSADDYKEPAQKLLSRLPVDDAKWEKYRDRLREHARKVKEVLAGNRPLYALADALDALLNEAADPTKPDQPNLQEFWAQSDQQQLRAELTRFVENVRFGDPLMVSGHYGKGNVVTYLSSAGNAWNDWPSGPARPYWVMLMLEVQKFLASVGPDANRAVGSTVELTVDPTKYEPRIRRTYIAEIPADAPPGTGPVDKGEQPGQVRGNKLVFDFSDAREPGIYRFDLVPKAEGAATPPKVESAAYAFNVDTVAEGDLRRANRDELAQAAPGMQLHSPGSGLATILKDRQSDLSESPWFFLLILAVLIAEQAMAVHLSHHLRGDVAGAVNLATRTGIRNE